MRVLFLSLLFITLSHFSNGQSSKPDAPLERQLRSALTGFRGNVGIYVHNFRTGKTVSINADTLFPTASTVKIPIQCGLFDKIHKGELKYDETVVYKDSLHYDDGIVGSLKDGASLRLCSCMLRTANTFTA